MSVGIIVGFDGSDCAKAALATGAEVAAVYGEKLIAAFCYDLRPLGGNVAEYGQALREVATARLQEAQSIVTASAPGVELEAVIVEHAPAEGLAELAKERDARVIIVGTRGEGPLHAALLGSTPHKLLQLADRPVLVVPGLRSGQRFPWRRCRSLVLIGAQPITQIRLLQRDSGGESRRGNGFLPQSHRIPRAAVLRWTTTPQTSDLRLALRRGRSYSYDAGHGSATTNGSSKLAELDAGRRPVTRAGVMGDHLIVLHSAVRACPGYNRHDAPSILLDGSSVARDTEHGRAITAQLTRRHGTLAEAIDAAAFALGAAGLSKGVRRQARAASEDYFYTRLKLTPDHRLGGPEENIETLELMPEPIYRALEEIVGFVVDGEYEDLRAASGNRLSVEDLRRRVEDDCPESLVLPPRESYPVEALTTSEDPDLPGWAYFLDLWTETGPARLHIEGELEESGEQLTATLNDILP